jgi:tetrahydromethanopterin S-methyltransferase subunit F
LDTMVKHVGFESHLVSRNGKLEVGEATQQAGERQGLIKFR